MQLICPSCSKRLTIHKVLNGQKSIKCPACGKSSEIPTADVSFLCLQCRQPLEAPSDMAGESIVCPACNIPMKVPVLRHRGTEKTDDNKDHTLGTKSCPNCGEPILKVAKKCKHCGSFMADASLTCPKCGGLRIGRCEMVYAAGTRTGTVSGTILGLDVVGDHISPVIGGGSVGTSSQGLLAQYAAPPKAPTSRFLKWAVLGWVFVGVPLLFYCVAHLEDWDADTEGLLHQIGGVGATLVFVGLSAVAGGAIGLIVAAIVGPSRKEKAHLNMLETWRSKWICETCGHTWVPRTTP